MLQNVYMALELDEFKPTLKLIQNLIDKNDLVTDVPYCEGGLETNPHVTIVYSEFVDKVFNVSTIGQVTYAKQKTLLENTLINLSKVSMFENDDFDVIKFEVNSLNCEQLHKFVKMQFGLETRFPTYQAHVTIGYVKSGQGQKYVDMFNGIIDGDFKPNKLKCVVREQHLDGEMKSNKITFTI